MKNNFKKLLLSASALLIVISCGRIETTDSQHPILSLSAQKEKRFTQQEIDQVYTNAAPSTQTAPIQKVYTMATAPSEFKQEWPSFTKAVEMKGFLNMSQQPTGGEPNDDATARSIVSTLQAFSKWKEIRDKNNRPLLSDAYTTDSWGDKMPDRTNGRIVKNPDFHYGRIVSGSFGIGLELKFTKMADGVIHADFVNPKAISIFPVGTVVKAQGMKIHVEFFPYSNGWLYYAVAAPKLEKFEDKADQLTETAEAIFLWLRKKVGK